MNKLSILEDLLDLFLNEVPDLLAALVIDLDGFIIAKKSIKEFDDQLIAAITSMLTKNLSQIKRYTTTELSSGSLDINEFRLFYIELGESTNALFVLVGNPYSNLDRFIPYAHIVADKMPLILNNQEISFDLPKIDKDGKLVLNPNSLKVLIIGSEGVGKSTLVETCNKGRFKAIYHPTLGVSFIEKELQLTPEKKRILSIFDLGGLKSFAKVRRYYYQYTDVVLILFDYSRIETFNELKDWVEEACQFVNEETTSFMIIGNKIDLVNNRFEIHSQALDFTENHNFSFHEISALTGEGIDELLNNLHMKVSHDVSKTIDTTPITTDFFKDLSEDEKILFICKIDCVSLEDLKIPDPVERFIIFNISKHKEISLAVLLEKLTPVEKALGRKIEREIVLKIVDKYTQKGQIIQRSLKHKENFNSLDLSKIIQRGNL